MRFAMTPTPHQPYPTTNQPSHALAAADVVGRLGTDRAGLSTAEAAARLERHGPNRVAAGEPESALRRLLRQFNDPMIHVLIAAAALTGLLGQWLDTLVILAVVVINAVIGFAQEGKAADALESIRDMLSLEARVRRDGAWHTVPADDLVPGDVVRLAAGDKVPADIRLTSTSSLRIEESALTGESVPVDKGTAPVAVEAGIGDRSSMAFSGTVVAAGGGTGVVTGTGQDTEIGHITTLLKDVESIETPLTRQMTSFSKKLSLVVVILAIGMFILAGILYDYSLSELTMAAIGFAVATIPEGLPAVLTITLALGVQKMARRNAITRRMNSVETLGSVTVICTDKTGTLTRNEMTVRTAVTPADTFEVTGTGYTPEGEIRIDGVPMGAGERPDLFALAQVAARANDSTVERLGAQWVLSGEPTDGGLRTFALKAGVSGDEEARIAVVPFGSAYKYMATLDETPTGRVVHLKGAPDRLLDRCDRQGAGLDETEPLDRAFWDRQIDELGDRGLRVLAAAARRAEPDTAQLDTDDIDAGGLVFLGLFGIIDPPRDEAIDAIRACREAGIRVKMITGDHAGTAPALAREMGTGEADTAAVTGAQLEAATDAELRVLATERDVFARTSPEHKLRLVQALQAEGQVVSMTGDGVNDAPSLKRADVGVAMGIKGTEATKEAADVVLADDNFATIADAVAMGRTIYDNLRKAIVFILPTNGAQGLVILVSVVLGMTLPLTPVQVLWVNTITAVTLSLALAFEPAEADIMRRPPRKPGGSILPRSGLIRIIYVSLLLGRNTLVVFFLGQQIGRDLELSRTVAVNYLVVGQVLFLFAMWFTRTCILRRVQV